MNNVSTLLLICKIYFQQKRQIFRENLLPEKGGKIPESAFHPQRLILNRLNQQGISVPDGFMLQQRRVEKHPFPKQSLPETIKVMLMQDGRYVAPPGRYHFPKPPSVDTTYVIRMPHKPMHNKGGLLSNAPLHFTNTWVNAAQGTANQYFKHSDVTKWEPPSWYNEISSHSWKNQDITDPAQVLNNYN